MGRGRLGGTKSKIRGKVGSEVYQLKRDLNGTLMQTVYAMPENPTYTNSEKQAKNRCIMGQIERMWHLLPDIIRQCYANVAAGALSFQEFSRLNYPLLKQDFDSHFDGNNVFDWQAKRVMNAPAGTWQLTEGVLPAVTWNNTECAQGWNNSYMIEWYKKFPNATYGDFLSLFGLQHGDTLVSVNFRQMYSDASTHVDVFKFQPRSDYAADKPWSEVDDEHVFVTDCPYRVFAGLIYNWNTFYFEIDAQDAPSWLKIACFAFFVVRPSENGTLFSSCKFRWALGTTQYGYHRAAPAEIFGSWQRQ